MKYNFVYLGSDWDLYKILFSDIQKLPNAIYIPGNFPPSNSLKGFFYRLHFNKNINRIIPLPGKKLWNGTYFHNSFSTENPICFIFSGSWLEFQDCEIEDYFRKKYPNSKIVLFLTDIVSKLKLIRFSNRPIDINVLKLKYDLILSYDKVDCEKYGFIYHPTVFSDYIGNKQIGSKSDVFFAGKAKKRLSKIIHVYEYLKKVGLKCDFIITEVDEKSKVYKDCIQYNSAISYTQYLQHALNSKCLLEIMQDDAVGFTVRVNEAVCLNKRLITNNPTIVNAPFFDREKICVINTDNIHIDKNFLQAIREDRPIDYHYKEHYSPIRLLEFIDSLL